MLGISLAWVDQFQDNLQTNDCNTPIMKGLVDTKVSKRAIQFSVVDLLTHLIISTSGATTSD